MLCTYNIYFSPVQSKIVDLSASLLVCLSSITTMSSDHKKTYDVAICGGGIGGLCLAVSILFASPVDAAEVAHAKYHSQRL